jgi:hypothetical protein
MNGLGSKNYLIKEERNDTGVSLCELLLEESATCLGEGQLMNIAFENV